jgi:acyl-homoserine-lactone acylase
VGFPVLNIAFNEHLGWTHTVNTIDASDRYELTLQDGGYLLDGKTQAFEKKNLSLKIRQPDGSLKTQDLALSYAKHGPVVGEKNGKAYAIRVAGLENALLSAQYHNMAKARNWKAFESALKMQQNPMFNVVYADQAGNILYLFNGNVPKRADGDWQFWHGTVDGTSSKHIWSQYHPYADLPRVFNPASGFVQNANDAPWTSTYPPVLKPESFPAYMSPRETMALRPQHAVNMIKDDASITYEELVAYKMNTGMEAADRFLDDLLAAVQQHPEPTADKAAAVLKTWDKATNADSRGAVLFARWFAMQNASMAATPFDPARPVATPNGLKDPQAAVAQLVKAATEVEKQYGAMDVAWGDVNRFKVGQYEFPANGGSGQYGIFRTMYFQRNAADNKNYAFFGDSYVAITEFGPKVRAQVLLSYGNATQPGSKHIGDQLSLLAEKKLRPALLTREEVMQNTEEKEQLRIQAQER